MKTILGLDLGTNSIGWALVKIDFDQKKGKINGLGSRIIPMSQDVMDKFGTGQSHSQTAERTTYRGARRLNQRHLLRRERLHRVLNKLKFLPEHYANAIDFEKHFGQFKKGKEVKLNYDPDENGNHKFLFMDSFREMAVEFKERQPKLFYTKSNGKETKIPLDWTIYYLRKKALTEKITKQELSWLLLNFNHKRGYYQLGENEKDEEVEGKEKTFEVLEVAKLVDSGETIKQSGETLHDVYFDNGWKYDKQITKPENWEGKTKEFIVTSTSLKSGDIKRTFKSVDSEKDWIAIKKKTEQDINTYINNTGKTVGCYIYDKLLENPAQKLNGKLVKTIERKYYKNELTQILEKQIKFHSELRDNNLYKACVEELYSQNRKYRDKRKDKDFIYLFVDDIIFYHRPLKSKKSTLSGCQYEYRTYQKKNDEGSPETIAEPLKVISRSHPLFKEFRLWQFLHNLKIYKIEGKSDIDITKNVLSNDEEWCNLFDFLNDKKEVEQKDIINYFIKLKRVDKAEKEGYRWSYVADKKYPMNETRSQFLSRLKQIEGINANLFLTKERELHLWHLVYSVKGKRHADEFEKALGTFAERHDIDKDAFVEKFKKCPSFESNYGAYSEKAIKKLLPLMRVGRYWNENDIPQEVKERVSSIVERIEHLQEEESESGNRKKKEESLKQAIERVADDAVPQQFIKSFLNFKGKNPLAGLSTYQACYAVYERHSEAGVIQQWKTPADMDAFLNEFKQHSLRNPIVEQVVLETLRTVRDIWKHYGNSEADFFDEIHVELGRDMKNPADKRKQISEQQAQNQNTNQRIKDILRELKDARHYSQRHQEILKIYEEGVYQNLLSKVDPKSKIDATKRKEIEKKLKEIDEIRKKISLNDHEIQKYKLWLEQGYISPYTGQVIPLSKLFSDEYQREHIIPQSRYFDDSLNNKVICESAVNEAKSNQTAFEFIKSRGGEVIDLGSGRSVRLFTLESYEQHCNHYFKKNRIKLNNLLSEEVPEDFIRRQLNDSRYISKYVKSLLSNIVRDEGEKEATAKNLVPVSGAITSKLKQDWGLNDKWNELIAPRFKRLNKLTRSQDFGYWDTKINAFRVQVPKELEKGFSKKRIDHRHHAMDALVIACCTKDHINYITSIETERTNHALVSKLRHQQEITKKNKNGEHVKSKVAKAYKLPWATFPIDAKTMLEKSVISFKQNLRIINKTNNKTWQWAERAGKLKKELVKQEKGDNWAIRKPLHTEMPYGKNKYDFTILKICENLGKIELIADKEIQVKLRDVLDKFHGKIGDAKKYLKKNPILDNGGKPILEALFNIQEERYRKRKPISAFANRGQGGVKKVEDAIKLIDKVSDRQIRQDLLNHLSENNYDIDLAFSAEGIEDFNSERKISVYKLPISESSTLKFSLGYNHDIKSKYVEAEAGTNLFFAIYWNEDKKERVYETLPLYEVIEHQKQRSVLPKEERETMPLIPVKPEKGQFLFSLSPNDLVYIPTHEEIQNPHLVNFNDLTKGQVSRIYKMVSCTRKECHFVPNQTSSEIKKNENGTNSKNERVQNIHLSETDEKEKLRMIKDSCWKLEADRLGHITKIIK